MLLQWKQLLVINWGIFHFIEISIKMLFKQSIKYSYMASLWVVIFYKMWVLMYWLANRHREPSNENDSPWKFSSIHVHQLYTSTDGIRRFSNWSLSFSTICSMVETLINWSRFVFQNKRSRNRYKEFVNNIKEFKVEL